MILFEGPLNQFETDAGNIFISSAEAWSKFKYSERYPAWKAKVADLRREDTRHRDISLRLNPKVFVERHHNAFDCSFDEKNAHIYERFTFEIDRSFTWDSDMDHRKLRLAKVDIDEGRLVSVILWTEQSTVETISQVDQAIEIVWDLIGIYRVNTGRANPESKVGYLESLNAHLIEFKDSLSNYFVQRVLLPYFILTEMPIPFVYQRSGTMMVRPLDPKFTGALPSDETVQDLIRSGAIEVFHPHQIQAIGYWIEEPKIAMKVKLACGQYIPSVTF